MSFDYPAFLFLLLLVLPLLFFIIARNKKRREGIDFLAAPAPSAEKALLKAEYHFRLILSDIFFMLFTLLIVTGLAGPRWGTVTVPENRRGLDLVLAFDISRSMNARDSPSGQNNEYISRLEKALAIAKELCLRLDDVRFGIAAGKGRGVLMVPLTWDSEAVFNLLDSLDESFMTGSGTNLESLLDTAASAFSDNMNRRRGIILFTDGEAQQGILEKALDRAVRAGIVISAVGLGSNSGSPVPVQMSPAAPSGFLLAPDNTRVISYRQEDILVNLAAKAGGIYADAGRADSAYILSDFYRSLAEVSAGGFRRESAARWQLFVPAGLLFFGLSRLLGFRWRKNHKGLVLLLSLLYVSCSQAEGKFLIMEGNYFSSRHRYDVAISSYLGALETETPYAEYGLGLSYSALDENDAALEQYAAAEKSLETEKGEHTELRYRLNFNRGIILFEQGNFRGAADSFRKALEIDGSRLDAKRNLELSLLAAGQTSNESPAAAESSGAETEDSKQAQALFDYLRQKEQDQWRSDWTADSNPVWPDY